MISSTRARAVTRGLLNMATSAPLEKRKVLTNVKERYIGRDDISGPLAFEAEIDDYSAFAQADDEEIDPPSKGQTVTGTVIEIDDNGALLEIGGKMSGYLPLKEASLTTLKNFDSILDIGQEVTGEIIGRLKGMPVMSLRSAQLVKAWEAALKIRATDEIFEVTVLEVNKGGAICEAFGLKAFLPGSHYNGAPTESLIGTSLKVRFRSQQHVFVMICECR